MVETCIDFVQILLNDDEVHLADRHVFLVDELAPENLSGLIPVR